MREDVKPPRRRYDASGRRARAQATRDRVAAIAGRLFGERGYAGTSVVEVAREADVSPETIYKAFGSKASLLAAAVTASIRGDTGDTPLRERPVIDAIRNEPDARRQLEMYGKLLAEVNPRLAPLARAMREAAPVDSEIADLLTQLKRNRLDSMREFAGLLAGRQALSNGVSPAQAADVLWSLNSPEVYELLVLERGWSRDRYGRWIARQLAAALLD